MSQQFRIILARHSQAVHNQKKKLLQRNLQTYIQFKKSQEYKNLKFCYQYIDRTQIDNTQIDQLIQKIDVNQIGLVIVSPLNRCLQTAKSFKFPQSISIIVQPLLSSRIASAWSIGRSLAQKKQIYSEMDYSFSQTQSENWCIDVLMKDGQNFRQFYDQYIQQHSDKAYNPQQLLLQYVKQTKGQSYKNVINRINKFKQKMTDIYMKKTNKKVLVISHSNILKVLTSNRVDQKGKARSDMDFNHLNFIECSQNFINHKKMQFNKKAS